MEQRASSQQQQTKTDLPKDLEDLVITEDMFGGLSEGDLMASIPLEDNSAPLLMDAVKRSGVLVIDCILGELEGPDEMLACLSSTDEFSSTVLHLAASTSQDNGVLESCLKALGSIYQTHRNGVDELLIRRDLSGSTVAHYAARRGLLAPLIDSGIFDVEIIRRLLLERNYTAETVIHFAVQRSDPSALHRLLQGIVSRFDRSVLATLFATKNHDGASALHYAVEVSALGVVDVLMNYVARAGGKFQNSLLIAKNGRGQTILHHASRNWRHPGVMRRLLPTLLHNYYKDALTKLVTAIDDKGRNFLHDLADDSRWVSEGGHVTGSSADMIQSVIKLLPKDLVHQLIRQRDGSGRTPGELSDRPIIRSCLDWAAGSHNDFYSLDTPPRVLVFYVTKYRSYPPEPNGHHPDAEVEKEYVVDYCREKGLHAWVVADPTEAEVRESVMAALDGRPPSALVVFIMGHGSKGEVLVKDKCVAINDVISWMASTHSDIPKVLIVQACQCEKDSPPPRPPKRSSDPPTSEKSGSAQHRSPIKSARGLVPARTAMMLRHSDFLVVMATTTGRLATRNVMVPALIEEMRSLSATDCVTEAFRAVNIRVHRENMRLGVSWTQIPIQYHTLTKKLCLGRSYPQTGEGKKGVNAMEC